MDYLRDSIKFKKLPNQLFHTFVKKTAVVISTTSKGLDVYRRQLQEESLVKNNLKWILKHLGLYSLLTFCKIYFRLEINNDHKHSVGTTQDFLKAKKLNNL